MSNEKPSNEKSKQPEPPTDAAMLAKVDENNKRTSIPVAMIKLHDQYPVEIPGNGVAKSAITGWPVDKVLDSATGKRRPPHISCHVIDFLPAIRHFRVVHFSSDTRAPQVRMVHETYVRSWEPL